MIDLRFVAGIVVSAGLASLAVWILYLRRMTPAERERRRLVYVNKTRRTTEALVTEATLEMIHFQYELRGVRYFASQDVRALGAYLPEDVTRLIGPVSVKYDSNNPANSIVVCEEWTGLPERKGDQRDAGNESDEIDGGGSGAGGAGCRHRDVGQQVCQAGDDHPRGDAVL